MKGVKVIIKERTGDIVQGALYIDATGTGQYSDVGPLWMSGDEYDIIVNMMEHGCSEDVQFVLQDNTQVELDDEY